MLLPGKSGQLRERGGEVGSRGAPLLSQGAHHPRGQQEGPAQRPGRAPGAVQDQEEAHLHGGGRGARAASGRVRLRGVLRADARGRAGAVRGGREGVVQETQEGAERDEVQNLIIRSPGRRG